MRSQAVAEISVERMLPEVSVDDLRAAWADIMKRARLNQHHHITREQLSVRDHMTHILRRLNDVMSSGPERHGANGEDKGFNAAGRCITG